MTSNIPPHPNQRELPSSRSTALTLVALVAVWATVLIESLLWIWGALFAGWALIGIVTGETFLLFTITRRDQPALFWLVSLSWLAIGVLWLIFPR